MILFDTHAHYEDSAFGEDRDAVLESVLASGVSYIVDCAQDVRTSRQIISMAADRPYMYCAVGIHPEQAGEVAPGDFEIIRELASPSERIKNKVVAIGETGLDYHNMFASKEQQHLNFRENIRIALEYKLPVIVHDREAHEDSLRILDEEHGFDTKVVFHCYSGSPEFAAELVKRGCYFSFGGAITFKNAKKYPDVLSKIPLSRIMLETDCPYMAPEPMRGTRNSSANVPFIAKKMAEILGFGENTDKIAEITTENAKFFFSI